jgi:2-dehydropantoate 2-reductase
VADPEALGVQDLVVIAVKAPALAGVAERIGPLIGPDTLVLVAMNGVPWWFLEGGFGGEITGHRLAAVDPVGAIAKAIPAHNVIGCVVHASCSLDGPGVVRHHFGNGLIIGEPSGQATPRVQKLVELLKSAGIDTTLSPQIQKDVWYKLWGNMTVNPISALTGATTDLIMGDDYVRGFISRDARSQGNRPPHRHRDHAEPRRPACGHDASSVPSRPRCCRTWKPAARWNSMRW